MQTKYIKIIMETFFGWETFHLQMILNGLDKKILEQVYLLLFKLLRLHMVLILNMILLFVIMYTLSKIKKPKI